MSIHDVRTRHLQWTSPLPYLHEGSNLRDSKSEDNVLVNAFLKKKNLPLTHWLAKVAAKIRTLFISTKGKTFFTEKILSTYILCFFHTKITITLILPRLTKPKQTVNQHIKSHIYIYRTKESGKSIKKRIPYKLTEKQTKSSKISVIIDKIKKKHITYE